MAANFPATSARERFENSTIVWALGLVLAASVAGWTARDEFGAEKASSTVACRENGIAELSAGHNDRLDQMQTALEEAEVSGRRASSPLTYARSVENADRIRRDLMQERSSYASTVRALAAACASG